MIAFAVSFVAGRLLSSDDTDGPLPAVYGRPYGGSEVVSLQGTEFYKDGGKLSDDTLARVRARVSDASSDLERLEILAMEACAIDQTYFDRRQAVPEQALETLAAYESHSDQIQVYSTDGGMEWYRGQHQTLADLQDPICQHASRPEL